MKSITLWTAGASALLLGGCMHAGMLADGGHMTGSHAGTGTAHRIGPAAAADENTTPGWTMMTPEERQAHRARMQSATSHGECMRLMDEHRQRMLERATERGVPPPAMAQRDMCAGMAH